MSNIPLNSDPPTPEEIVAQLRALREQLRPVIVPAAPASLRRRLAHVAPDFVQAAISATGASAVLRQAVGRSDQELRAEIDMVARWTAVADEARTFLQVMIAANTVRRQSIGLAALQTYQISRQLARNEANADLISHINEMKRLNKFGRVRRRGSQTPPPEQQKT